VVILCPEGPLAEEIRALNGDVVPLPFGPDAGPLTSAASLRRAIRMVQPRVVHSHLSYAHYIVSAATPRGILTVSTEHGIAADDLVYHGSRPKAGLMAAVNRARLRRCDVLLAVSEATRAAMESKWGATGVLVTPNGVDREPLAAGPGPTGPEPRILSLARLAPEKRIGDLLHAFAALREVRPQATLTIAGTGPLEASLRDLTTRLCISDAVEFPGYIDAAEALRTHDVLALLSVWENCSYALLDAVAAHVGVVASNVGGNPEIVPPRCLVDATDHRAVAAALIAQADPAQHPDLPENWPTVTEMTAALAAIYEDGAR
jgi:glycosyltransferase involved in cell wall biosynthesis